MDEKKNEEWKAIVFNVYTESLSHSSTRSSYKYITLALGCLKLTYLHQWHGHSPSTLCGQNYADRGPSYEKRFPATRL